MTASLLVLAGCVSSPKTALDATDGKGNAELAADSADPLAIGDAEQDQKTRPRTPADGRYSDPVVATAATAQDADPVLAASVPETPADLGGMVLKSTGINASRSSIFSSGTPPLAADDATGDIPAYAPTTAVNPAFKNVYSRTPDGQADAKLPSDDLSQAGDAGTKTAETGKAAPSYAIAFKKTDYIGADDLPLSMASGFYASHDLNADDDQPVGLMKLASISGLARSAAHGLKVQTGNIEVGCFKPKLVGIIKSAEAHFGRPAVVTSGFRNVSHNRNVGGVEGSLHTSCDAADIQVNGVSKWELAAFLRTQPGRGGVGTYCHTASVHIDTGRARDWNWRCRQKEV